MEKRKRKSTNSDKVNDLDEEYKTGVKVKKPKNDTSSETAPSESKQAVYWLKIIAESGGIQSIKDPVTWQKDIHKDRSLFPPFDIISQMGERFRIITSKKCFLLRE